MGQIQLTLINVGELKVVKRYFEPQTNMLRGKLQAKVTPLGTRWSRLSIQLANHVGIKVLILNCR